MNFLMENNENYLRSLFFRVKNLRSCVFLMENNENDLRSLFFRVKNGVCLYRIINLYL